MTSRGNRTRAASGALPRLWFGSRSELAGVSISCGTHRNPTDLSAILSSQRYQMRFKKRESLLSALLGTGLYLLENLRERLPNDVDDIKGRAKETYETASDRLGHATDALRGKEDSHIFGNVSVLLIDFLGFTHISGKNGLGRFMVRRTTIRKRM